MTAHRSLSALSLLRRFWQGGGIMLALERERGGLWGSSAAFGELVSVQCSSKDWSRRGVCGWL